MLGVAVFGDSVFVGEIDEVYSHVHIAVAVKIGAVTLQRTLDIHLLCVDAAGILRGDSQHIKIVFLLGECVEGDITDEYHRQQADDNIPFVVIEKVFYLFPAVQLGELLWLVYFDNIAVFDYALLQL